MKEAGRISPNPAIHYGLFILVVALAFGLSLILK